MRRLVVVLGDQLNADSAAFDEFDPRQDAVWMAEAPEEATHVPSHKARIALFLSAMRHFRDRMRRQGFTVYYQALGEHGFASLSEALSRFLIDHRPQVVRWVRPGDWRVWQALTKVVDEAQLPLELCPDRHFISSLEAFDKWAEQRKETRLEHWYRLLRKQTGLLMEQGKPAGGKWNFDAENRRRFDARGPGWVPEPRRFEPDVLTREVLDLVSTHFADHPGSLAQFDWPVTPKQAREALDDFVLHRLPAFGDYQDAMWIGETWLYHSRLSAALNLKLIDPMSVLKVAEQAWQDGHAPLNAVEGLVRQILGWREYVRGLYWRHMPDFLQCNALEAYQPLPTFYWNGQTEMRCLSESITQTLMHGYAHHIQRLMVTGLFAQLLGVRPTEIHAWFLAMYVDAVEWVELPNVMGMSQYADGGIMASKPYVASGKYIQRMSNYCRHCRYDPAKAIGEDACPFTTLYWHFLQRHAARFASHPRTALQWKNLSRLDDDQRAAIERQARKIHEDLSN